MKQLKLIQLIRTVQISMVKRPMFFVLITREVDITRAHLQVDPFLVLRFGRIDIWCLLHESQISVSCIHVVIAVSLTNLGQRESENVPEKPMLHAPNDHVCYTQVKGQLCSSLNPPTNQLRDSLVVQCWLRVRKVPGSVPSQGPRHTKDVIKIVPVFPLFSTDHKKGKHWLFLKNKPTNK